MKNTSLRGAARISAIWMIAVVVVFFVAVAFAYISQQDATAARSAEAAAKSKEVQAIERADTESLAARTISESLGFYDREVAGSRTNLAAAASGLSTLKDTFSDLDDTHKTFEDVVPVVIAQYTAKDRQIATLQSQVADLTGQVASLRSSLNDVSSSKDAEIRDLNTQLTDAQNAARSAQQDLETRLASITSARNDVDTELRGARGTISDLNKKIDQNSQASETRFEQLSKMLAFTKEPGGTPDGEILAVSKQLGVAWINLGARNRLSRGMTFDVISGDPNDNRVKGSISVTKVEPNRAEVILKSLTDRYDPIVPGDLVSAPLFDPSGERYAVMIGRFSGDYNRKELALKLDEIGIKVQKKLDFNTAYLIVGSELYEDENGEPYEEPVQPSELPEYKEAEALGVQVVSINDLRRFFAL